MKTVSQDNIKICRFVASAIGFAPHVDSYWDNVKENSLDVLSVEDPLDKEVKFYCTIGVSDSPNIIEMSNNQTKDIRIELLITGYNKFDKIPNILSTCGFYITKDKWDCQPSTVYKNMINLYYPNSDMKHILFMRPFLWEDKLTAQSLETKVVHFLLCVPISDKELDYKLKNGTSALEELFEETQIDLFDINRKSIL